jgi:hypothetical protein
MPVLILSFVLLTAPALQGVWGFRTQFLFEAAVFLSGGAWLLRETLAGRRPAALSDPRNLPLLAAAFFSLLSALLSPVRELVVQEWWNFAAGLFVVFLAGSLSPDGQGRTGSALRVSAWFIALLSLYQALFLKNPDVSASLTNPNALALFILLALPAAAARRDLPLVCALCAALALTRSAAALAALLIAGAFYARDSLRPGMGRRLLPAVLAAIAAGAVLYAWQADPGAVADRLGWWKAALRMFAARPAFGFGPGSFAYVYPAVRVPGADGVLTIYAHNYYLEFLAEDGLPAFLALAWAVLLRLRTARGPGKYALIAALAHSWADFGLAVPGVYFIFCFLLGSSAERSAEVAASESGVHGLPDRRKALFAAALAAAVFIRLCGAFSAQLELEKLRARAESASAAGDGASAELELSRAAVIAPRNPAVPVLLSAAYLKGGIEKKDGGRLFAAASELERALLLDPYNAGAWRDLERLYSAAGERRLAEGLRARKAEVFRP